MSNFFSPHALHEGSLPRIFNFFDWQAFPSKVDKNPSKLLYPFKITFKASIPKIIPTYPGSIPITPKVEHPPILT